MFNLVPKSDKSSSLSHLYTQFPSLVAQNQSCTKFSWLKHVGCVSLIVRLVCPNYPDSKGSKIHGDESTLFLLENSKVNLSDAIESSESVSDLLHKLNDLLTEIEKSNPKLSLSGTSAGLLTISSQILTELETVGWSNVSTMSPDIRWSSLHLHLPPHQVPWG